MEISKEQFGIEIIKLLKERQLTQRGLAKHLNLTSASVCYILKNKLRPSAAQFDGIMEYIHADAFQINRLRKYWRATQKERYDRSGEKENFFAIRCALGVTVEEVSASTGISPERIRILENKANEAPTPEELALLHEYYGDNPELLDGLHDEEENAVAAVAEEFVSEFNRGEKSLPVFTIDVLSRAAKAGTLEKFLGGLPFNNALFNISALHLQRAKAVLICNAEDIHYGFNGRLELILAEHDPESDDALQLGKGNRGGFALWQKMRRAWKYFGAEHPVPRMANSWSLPVLEMRFVAASLRQEKSEKSK